MTSRYDGSKDTATHLLQHYFRLTAQRAGVQWDSDNDAEIESIVEALITASVQEVRQELETASVIQEAVTHTVHGVLDARAQITERLRRELDAVDLYAQIAAETDATQQEGAHIDAAPLVTCPLCGHTDAAHYSSDRPHYLECDNCHVLWQRATGNYSACPACHGVTYVVHTDNAGPDMAMCVDCGHSAYWHDFHQEWHAVTHVALSACAVCKDTQEE